MFFNYPYPLHRIFAKIVNSFSQNSSIVDVRLGSKFAPEVCWFVMKLHWLKFYLPQQAQALKQEYINSGKLSMKWENIRTCRSSRPEVFCKKAFLEISLISQENICAWVSFLIKLQVLGLWHRCFPVNFAKFLRTRFSIEHLRWMLPHMYLWNASGRKVLITRSCDKGGRKETFNK